MANNCLTAKWDSDILGSSAQKKNRQSNRLSGHSIRTSLFICEVYGMPIHSTWQHDQLAATVSTIADRMTTQSKQPHGEWKGSYKMRKC